MAKYVRKITDKVWNELLKNPYIFHPETVYNLILDLVERMEEIKENIKGKKPEIAERYNLAVKNVREYLKNAEPEIKKIQKLPKEEREKEYRKLATEAYSILVRTLGDDLDFVFESLERLYEPLKLGEFLRILRENVY